MKANQSFCCGFCFEGSSRDELSTISYLTMKGCVVSACDFQTGYFRRRVFGEERHSCASNNGAVTGVGFMLLVQYAACNRVYVPGVRVKFPDNV